MNQKRKTKALSWLLTLTLVLALIPVMSLPAYATNIADTALTWEVNGSTLTISGTGTIPDYTFNYSANPKINAPWGAYMGSESSITSIVIGNGVTRVGNWSFGDFEKVTSISLPSTLQSIGDSAFQECVGLTSVTIPENVTSIGNLAFSNCQQLGTVTFARPNAAATLALGNTAFSTDAIGNGTVTLAFSGSTTSLYDADGVTEIEAGSHDVSDISGKTLKWKVPHTHSFGSSYALGRVNADNDTITATCGTSGCTLTDSKTTLTIAAPLHTAVGDGKTPAATLTGLTDFNTATGKSIAATDIKYVGKDGTAYAESTTAPTTEGKYTAKITVEGVTASVDYEITNPNYTISLPTGLTNGTVTADKTAALLFCLNVADTVTLDTGIVNLLSVTVTLPLLASLTVRVLSM